jgi:hypothetical protein
MDELEIGDPDLTEGFSVCFWRSRGVSLHTRVLDREGSLNRGEYLRKAKISLKILPRVPIVTGRGITGVRLRFYQG